MAGQVTFSPAGYIRFCGFFRPGYITKSPLELSLNACSVFSVALAIWNGPPPSEVGFGGCPAAFEVLGGRFEVFIEGLLMDLVNIPARQATLRQPMLASTI
jgi:hypothetical protein